MKATILNHLPRGKDGSAKPWQCLSCCGRALTRRRHIMMAALRCSLQPKKAPWRWCSGMCCCLSMFAIDNEMHWCFPLAKVPLCCFLFLVNFFFSFVFVRHIVNLNLPLMMLHFSSVAHFSVASPKSKARISHSIWNVR